MSRKSLEKKNITPGERLWRILVTVLGAIFLFCIITYLVTPLFMVHPNKDSRAAASLEDVVIPVNISGTNELSGYLRDDPGSDRLLIFFYGIENDAAQSMQYFLENAATYSDLDIAVVDWPSYGDSHGICTADSMRAAARDTVNAFSGAGMDGYSCDEIIIMGYSLGTGPAVYAASECGCADLILIAPYYSSADLYNNVIPIFYGPLEGLAGFSMDSFLYAGNVNVSPLIIASETDARVPYKSSQKLAECFPGGCSFISCADIEHGNLPWDPQVLDAITARLGN